MLWFPGHQNAVLYWYLLQFWRVWYFYTLRIELPFTSVFNFNKNHIIWGFFILEGVPKISRLGGITTFTTFFGPSTLNLSQNWISDCHFEVLNKSQSWLVQKLWQKWKTCNDAQNAKITINITRIIFFLQNRKKMKIEIFAFCGITFKPIVQHLKMTVWYSVL